MSHWNYRLCVETKHIPGEDPKVWSIREIYYDDENQVEHWSSDPIDVQALSLDDLAWMFGKFTEALSGPLYDLDNERWIDNPFRQNVETLTERDST